jgi:hypothetical protein
MHRNAILAAALLLILPACDAIDRARGRRADTEPTVSAQAGPLTLGLHTPGALSPGEEGIIRVTLSNRGDTGAHELQGMHVEVYVPEWMEPMPPRMGDPEVTMAAADEAHTRFTFQMHDTLPGGETLTFDQRVRVAPTREDGALTWSRVVRARLLGPAGRPVAEIESEVGVQRGEVTDDGPDAPPAAAQPRDRLGPARLGMTAAALRQAAPGARDTTWQQEGTEERGVVVPLEGSAGVLAVLAGDSVSRIEVRNPQPRTAERLGVGSRYSELRAAYGRACAAVGEGIVVVWFPGAPGISFALDAPVPQNVAQLRDNPDSIPADARVTRWWLRRGTDGC